MWQTSGVEVGEEGGSVCVPGGLTVSMCAAKFTLGVVAKQRANQHQFSDHVHASRAGRGPGQTTTLMDLLVLLLGH